MCILDEITSRHFKADTCMHNLIWRGSAFIDITIEYVFGFSFSKKSKFTIL